MPKFSKEFKLAVLAVFIAFFSFVFFKGDLSILKSQPNAEPLGRVETVQGEAGSSLPARAVSKDSAANEEPAKTENPEPKNKPAETTEDDFVKKEEKKPVSSVAGIKESPKSVEEVAGNMENAPNAEDVAQDGQSASLRREMYPVIFYVNNEKFETSVLPQSTAYDLMVSLKNQRKISFSGENYSGLGFFVKEINGIKNNPKTGEFWLYYINKAPAWVGVSGYELKPGDIISWKYVKDTL